MSPEGGALTGVEPSSCLHMMNLAKLPFRLIYCFTAAYKSGSHVWATLTGGGQKRRGQLSHTQLGPTDLQGQGAVGMGRYSGRSSRLIFMCFVSLVLFAVEISVAYVGNSLSLASDAFAVLSHLISMIIGLLGVRFSRIRWHKANTFGFSRADVLGAFGNSVFAVALMFSIFIEAIKRYINPQKTEKALLVLIVGIAGLFFNVFNYVIFMDCCYCRAPEGDPEKGK